MIRSILTNKYIIVFMFILAVLAFSSATFAAKDVSEKHGTPDALHETSVGNGVYYNSISGTYVTYTNEEGGGGGGGGGGYTRSCVRNTGSVCVSASNTCGAYNKGTVLCNGSCSETTAPAVPASGCPSGDPDVDLCAVDSCAGTEYGGYCWYLGNNGKSCDSACSSHGGVNMAGTRDYAGSGGTFQGCRNVLITLRPGITGTYSCGWGGHYGSPGNTSNFSTVGTDNHIVGYSSDTPYGCVLHTSTYTGMAGCNLGIYSQAPTTLSDSVVYATGSMGGIFQRACACNN